MPHRVCLMYFPELIAWMAIMDLLIAAAYIAIPTSLHVYSRSSGVSVPKGYRLMIYGFEAFIFLCGATHIMNFVTLWWPLYELEAIVAGACAATSILVAVALIRSAPDWSLDHWRNAMRIIRAQRDDEGDDA